MKKLLIIVLILVPIQAVAMKGGFGELLEGSAALDRVSPSFEKNWDVPGDPLENLRTAGSFDSNEDTVALEQSRLLEELVEGQREMNVCLGKISENFAKFYAEQAKFYAEQKRTRDWQQTMDSRFSDLCGKLAALELDQRRTRDRQQTIDLRLTGICSDCTTLYAEQRRTKEWQGRTHNALQFLQKK